MKFLIFLCCLVTLKVTYADLRIECESEKGHKVTLTSERTNSPKLFEYSVTSKQYYFDLHDTNVFGHSWFQGEQDGAEYFYHSLGAARGSYLNAPSYTIRIPLTARPFARGVSFEAALYGTGTHIVEERHMPALRNTQNRIFSATLDCTVQK